MCLKLNRVRGLVIKYLCASIFNVEMIKLFEILLVLALASAGASATAEKERAEKEFQQIAKEMNDLANSKPGELLLVGAKIYNKQREAYSTRFTAEEALALPIWRHYRDNKLHGLRMGKKFNHIYNEFVVKICASYIKLDRKLESFISKYKKIEDWRQRNESLPQHWANTIALCGTQSDRKSKDKVFIQFRAFEKSKTE